MSGFLIPPELQPAIEHILESAKPVYGLVITVRSPLYLAEIAEIANKTITLKTYDNKFITRPVK